MTTTLWCNIDDPETNAPHQIGHPFSDADPNRRRLSDTQPADNGYDEVTTVVDMCGYHWEKNNPFRKKEARAEILQKDESYNEGWRDAESHYR